MNKVKQTLLYHYRFAWINNANIERKHFTIQLTDLREQDQKNTSQRDKNRLRRFLVRLRSD